MAEWAFKVGRKKRSTIITIYDYKEKQLIEKVELWHVGSNGNDAVVHRFLNNLFPPESIEIKGNQKQVEN